MKVGEVRDKFCAKFTAHIMTGKLLTSTKVRYVMRNLLTTIFVVLMVVVGMKWGVEIYNYEFERKVENRCQQALDEGCHNRFEEYITDKYVDIDYEYSKNALGIDDGVRVTVITPMWDYSEFLETEDVLNL